MYSGLVRISSCNDTRIWLTHSCLDYATKRIRSITIRYLQVYWCCANCKWREGHPEVAQSIFVHTPEVSWFNSYYWSRLTEGFWVSKQPFAEKKLRNYLWSFLFFQNFFLQNFTVFLSNFSKLSWNYLKISWSSFNIFPQSSSIFFHKFRIIYLKIFKSYVENFFNFSQIILLHFLVFLQISWNLHKISVERFWTFF